MRYCMNETSLSWAIFGNIREKLSKKSSLVGLYNKQNDTWLLVDMDFSCVQRDASLVYCGALIRKVSSSTLGEKFHI